MSLNHIVSITLVKIDYQSFSWCYYSVAREKYIYYIAIADNDEKIMVLDNMKDILGKLPSDQFIRIHRSYIIPTDKIKLIEGNQIQLHNQEFVPIGETYRKVVSEWLEGK